MRIINLKPHSAIRINKGEREFSEGDFDQLPKGLIPGEWIIIHSLEKKENYIGYANLFSENFYKIKVLEKDFHKKWKIEHLEHDVAKTIISEKLKKSVESRQFYKGYQNGCRLVYGASDELPGLIVDKYEKYVLLQINTAGLDRFREEIKSFFETEFPSSKVLFFDNKEYRKSEQLPDFQVQGLEGFLTIEENDLKYELPANIIQKIGFYYDHRENRLRLINLLSKLNRDFEKGLDLFSYVGSWGLHMLKGKVKEVKFVDQADMEVVIARNLEINKLSSRGIFVRSDVFKFLDQAKLNGEIFDIIVSDPPAFTKSEKSKPQALLGYEKLHSKAMSLLSNNSIFVAASCTHHVSFSELDKTVKDAAFKNNLNVKLLDLGGQGFDHPFSSFEDKGFYIKYIAYQVQRGA